MSKQEIKSALVSLIVGFLISLITIIAQAAIAWLQDIPTELPGAVGGMITYAWKVRFFT